MRKLSRVQLDIEFAKKRELEGFKNKWQLYENREGQQAHFELQTIGRQEECSS